MKQTLALATLVAALGLSTSAMADNLLETLASDGGFKTMISAIKSAGMESTFTAAGPVTVFAPTDDAFDSLPKAKRDALLADKAALKKLISHLVVDHKVTKADVEAGKVKSLQGDDLTLSVAGGIKVDSVPVVGSGINADNGVIHAMTSVPLPKS